MSDPLGCALVVLPTYNERDNLERVVAGVRATGHHVLVVDDSSPDGTGQIADQIAASEPAAVSVLHRPSKQGLGTAYMAGFHWGMERGYRLLVEMDADGSHLPEYLDPIVKAASSSGGMAVGSRYVPGGSVVGWGFRRTALSRYANVYARTVLGLPTRDCTSGYRCYTKAALDGIKLDTIRSQGYSFQIEMVYRCTRAGLPVVEVPIRFEDRIQGQSKVSEGEVRKALLAVLQLRLDGWR